MNKNQKAETVRAAQTLGASPRADEIFDAVAQEVERMLSGEESEVEVEIAPRQNAK
jgi:hypothetical protein